MIWKLKTKKWLLIKVVVVLFLCMNMTSCVQVKPYQRAYLEDRDMKFKQSRPQAFENYSHSIREGAAGGGMGKSSGGCGCN